MKHHAELIYLIKQMLQLRRHVDGHESPIIIDLGRLDKKFIPDLDFLNRLLLSLADERVPVEGESSRQTVISHMEPLDEARVTVYLSSTAKLEYFLKRIGGTDEARGKRILPTVHLPQAVSWERVRMIVNETNDVFVFYQDETGGEGSGNKIDFEDLGMKGQGKNKPGKLWWEFRNIAQSNGVYQYSARDQTLRRKNKDTLASLLQQRFALPDDPFEKIEDMHYKTKFVITYQAEFPHETH